MNLQIQLQHQLQTLYNLLQNLSVQQYTYKSKYLANASIGGHTRHIIELLQCAIQGYEIGLIDYVNRERNLLLETDMQVAFSAINLAAAEVTKEDTPLGLVMDDGSTIITTYYRELLYNLEHIIHHLALIKVSLIELNVTINDENFGVAYSTIKYRNSLLQS